MNRIRGFEACVILLAVACLESSVFAAGWQIDPYMKAKASFDDNVRFVDLNPKESSVGILELGADFKNESEIVKTELRPRIRYSGYASEGDLSNDAQFLDFSTRSNGERSSPSLDINLTRDNALDQLGSNDAAINPVLVNKQRDRWRVKPEWSYRFSEQDALDLSLEVDSVSYDDPAGTSLVDYVNQIANLSYVRSLSEIKDFTVRLSQTQYESDPNGSTHSDGTLIPAISADTTGIELGITNEFTERTKGSVFIGGENTDSSERVEGVKQHSGLTVEATVDHETAKNTASVGLSRGIVPGLDGIVRNQDSLWVKFDRVVDVKFGWGIDVFIRQSKAINQVGAEDIDFYSFEPSLTWSLTNSWSLVGTYRVSFQEFSQSGGEADRNELGLSIEYRRPPREQLELPIEEP